jgi:hypothetical protein
LRGAACGNAGDARCRGYGSE